MKTILTCALLRPPTVGLLPDGKRLLPLSEATTEEKIVSVLDYFLNNEEPWNK